MDDIKMPKIERPPSLQERAYQLIRQSIVSGVKRGGEPLVVERLASELGVSRTPIREALLRLEQEGLVESMPHKGTFVATLSREKVAQLFQIRAVLESLAVELAAPCISDEQLHRMNARLDRIAGEAEDRYSEEHFHADTDFHDLFLENVPNEMLREMLGDFRDKVYPIRVFSKKRAGKHLRESNREHLAILTLLIEGDSQAAAAQMRYHIERAGDRILALLDE